ncbi:cobaltochelatase subunit CobN [Desulfomonile tiedjei]|uniref:Mg chelatase, cobalamin biosynthesis protein CobN n=1 Tax=Desulfomonile tiedjei (strain ATCC 49306 / DSM 6799 / DCB-1) TaxID=706587 RepID=I4C8X3_DESTA|nr:cobaltochelatase subunit CobN [Desulfomonile tiedjei]AFM26014.1 Mg chelatase, cobalamin biosynthesis protein CobN [Desulfomonile tiedjei DSM 6799]
MGSKMRAFIAMQVCLAVGLCSQVCHANHIAFLVSDSDTLVVSQAVRGDALPKTLKVSIYSPENLEKSEKAKEGVRNADVIIVDVMIHELVDHLEKNIDVPKRRIYAVRASRDDESLKKRGIVFDDEVREFYHHLEPDNIRSLILKVANREFDRFILYEKPKPAPLLGMYHPDSPASFPDPDSYLAWYRGREGFRPEAPMIALLTYSPLIGSGQVDYIDQIIRKLEDSGFSVATAFGWDPEVLNKLMRDKSGKPYMDIVLAFSLKFQSALDESVFSNLKNLDVPIFNLLNVYYSTIKEWQTDPRGLTPIEVGWAVSNPELSGLIEPSAVSGKEKRIDEETGQTVFLHKAIADNLELIIPRIGNWLQLRRKPNAEKKVVILFYNNTPGKQNVGASYLNVFASLQEILDRLRKEGFAVGSRADLTSETIRDLILKTGRNIGNWAPGELDDMLRNENVVRVPVATYMKWFAALPEDFRKGVLDQWGEVDKSDLMIRSGEIIVPGIIVGNVMLMPEPSRGFTDDPMKLYHSPILYPHHQYVAAYLWMKHGFQADVQIHLGTHGTHEWLPGKQVALSTSCPPDVLITDIPSLYPYIVDDVGEGIQAKRRGRAVVVDHLIPAVKEGGLYQEYSKLYSMISQYYASRSTGAETAGVRLQSLVELIKKLGIDKDLGITEIGDEQLRSVENYLIEVQGNFMPYGLHTFGLSPDGEALSETVQFILKMHPKREGGDVSKRLSESGPMELDRLVAGLNGRYVPPGEGNDPFRNPNAIPTGKNFYGFDPAKIPSQAAYKLGVKAAEEIIDRSLKEKKKYPEKVAMVLWATETIRNEGINEATILHLMGMRPLWDSSDRIAGVEPIPGSLLKRPRIDVLINASGLYRDLFPNMFEYLDQAVQKAAVLTDIENLIRKNNDQIEDQLMQSGIPKEKASILSRMRIFSEMPGNYGNRVSELSSASGLWEKDDEIAKVFQQHTGYAYGQGKWGNQAQEALRENLKRSDVAVHSISSTVYGTMDNDDMFQYLGGLSLAISKERGEAPDTVVTLQQRPDDVKVESLGKTIGKELRTRYLNPKWIDGMKKEDYAGAREMSNFVDYMWGWQTTTPFAVDEAKWRETYEVYVEDKYKMDIKEFFNKTNPWAYQSIAARMLESIRKDYWRADDATKKKLAAEYAVNVVEQGIACCDHTCNNPMLNTMVMNIVSIPGVLSPEIVEKFRLAVEKAIKKTLDQQTTAMADIKQQVNEGFSKQAPAEAKEKQKKEADDKSKEDVEGYKMEEVNSQDKTTELPSSGAQWYAIVFSAAVIVLVGIGMIVRNRRSRNH